MARNYGREYARRQERAKERGWSSYNQQRYARSVVEKSDAFQYYEDNGYIQPEGPERDEAIKAMYMMRLEGDRDYGKDSWHYYFLVEVMGYMTEEEWEDHYPTGVRTYVAHH